MKKPKPVAVTTVCSVCGLGWELHGEDPTTDDCIRLLKAELASRPAIINYPTIYPRPYVQPRWPQPYGPYWVTNVCTNTANAQTQFASNTPRAIETTCRAVTS